MKTSWNVWTRLPGAEWQYRSPAPETEEEAARRADQLDKEAAGQDVLRLPDGMTPSSDPELQRIARLPRKPKRKK